MALLLLSHPRALLLLFLAAAGLWISSCATPLGPGYSIEGQEISVKFASGSNPKIRVDSEYRLRNTGTRPLSSLEVRLPARRLFHVVASHAAWDTAALDEQVSPDNPRNTLLTLSNRWNTRELHTLRLSADFQNPAPGETGLSFASDAFFLPSEGWAPELLPSQGPFGIGGIPPKQWRLSVTVPNGFLIHTSGRHKKTSRSGREITVLSVQRPEDRYPFVVAGLYKETSLNTGKEKVSLWTRAQEDAERLHQSADALARAIQAYNATFGTRVQNGQPLWLVECPEIAGCFSTQQSSYAELLGSEPGKITAELASQDTLMMDFTGGAPKLAAVAPLLAASWLGYGQNPGFYEQQPPLSALPAFASSLGQEAILGPSVRAETIRRALRIIPKTTSSRSARKPEDPDVLRAKSFLFFYALQDRYGQEAFRRAINHMLTARWERGFNLDDLIAAFEQETNQNVAEFVRLWMKHPGVPDEFRSRYETASASIATTSKETMP